MEARPDLTVKALSFKRHSISYWPKTLRSRREPDKTYNFSSKMESNSQKPFPLERKIISLICQKTKKKTACNRSFVHFLCNKSLTYSGTSFLVFLTIADAITNFQVLDQYFPFCKKILSVFRSWSAASCLGPIEKLYLLKKSLWPLC